MAGSVHHDLSGPWSAIVRAPFVRIAVPFMVGIALAGWAEAPWPPALFLFLCITPAAAALLFLPILPVERWKRGLALSLWFLCTGILWQAYHDPATDPVHGARIADRDGIWSVRITAVNGSSARTVRADAELLGLIDGDTLLACNGRAMLTLLHDGTGTVPRRGDRLLLDAPLRPIARTPDPGGFDRAAWAASRGMAHELFAPHHQWRVVDHERRWTDAFLSVRERVSQWIDEAAPAPRERALVKALVLGQRDELDSEQRTAFARSGTIHVLAVSGLHVGIIYGVLAFLLGWWGGGDRARLVRGLFILAALWAYAGITGAAPSVMRATIMFSLFTVAGMAGQRTDHLNSLFAAAFLILLWDPTQLGRIGFQLSFLAVFGIILLHDPIHTLWNPRHKVLRGAWSLAVVSIAAQLLTLPAGMYHFGAIPTWFLPANLLVVFAVGIAVPAAAALLVLYQVPLIGGLLTSALMLLLKGIGLVTAFFARLPGAYPEVRIDAMTMLLLYILILGVAARSVWRWRRLDTLVLAVVALLFLVWGLRAREANTQACFTVFDDHRQPFASIREGRRFTVLADDSLWHTTPALRTKAERYRAAFGLEEPAMLSPQDLMATVVGGAGPTIAARGRWRSPRFDVRFLDGREPFTPNTGDLRHDVLVVLDGRHLNDEDLAHMARSARHVVLAGRMAIQARESLRMACAEQGSTFHHVREQGAFVLYR